MIRTASVVVLVALTIAAGAGALPSRQDSGIGRYFARIDAQIDTYRRLLKRFERLYTAIPQVNVDPFVESLYRLADAFEDLDGRWGAIDAPAGLRARHRGMGRVYTLFGEAIRIHAAAVFTRHPDEILAARPKVEARFRSAAYLQYRWAAALQGALRRADLKVPGWLHGMAALKP